MQLVALSYLIMFISWVTGFFPLFTFAAVGFGISEIALNCFNLGAINTKYYN